MDLTLAEWSVVIAGNWNRAILTPSGIAKHLFDAPDETPLDVLVSLDEYAPYQVKHNGVVVIAHAARLALQVVNPGFAGLERAMKAASNALTSLPRTPVRAAGINCCFKCNAEAPSLASVIELDSDSHLADSGYVISARATARSVNKGRGKIKIQVDYDLIAEQYGISLNFHLDDKSSTGLRDWVNQPIAEIQGDVEKILNEYLGLDWKGVADDRK